MKKLILITFLLINTIHLYPVYFKHLGIREGLSQLSVMSIYQDEIGRMWFGTLEGLNMYNGKDITVFKPESSSNPVIGHIPGNDNRFITGDKKGNVFFLSDFSLMKYNIELQTFSVIKENQVSCLHYTGGSLFYTVQDSVFIWDSSSGQSDYFFCVHEPGATVQKIYHDSAGNVWIGSRSALYFYSSGGRVECLLPGENIFDVFEDSRKRMWIATYDSGVFMFEGGILKEHFTDDPASPDGLPSNQVRCFVEDNYGNIWIGTFTGLTKYNPLTRVFITYDRDVLPGSLQHNSIFSLFKGEQGTIWIGTYYGGVHYFNPETDIFSLYTDNDRRDDCLSFPFVGNMTEDNYGNIWICTEGGGLNFFDRRKKRFVHYTANGEANSIAHNNLKDICYNSKYEKLFIGTHTGGLSVFDIKKKRFENLSPESPFYPGQAGYVVNHVGLYNQDTLLFLTQNGLYKMDISSYSITPFYEKGPLITGTGFTVDSKKNVWVANQDKVVCLTINEPENIRSFYNNRKGLGDFRITKIFEDRKGNIFFGTLGSGLYRYNPVDDYFISFKKEDGLLLSNYCYDIQQSLQGYILVSGDKGLTFLNPDNFSIKTVDISTALPIQGINLGCGVLVCKNGEIFVGGIDGMTSFFEQELFSAAKEYKLFFTELNINNEPVHPLDRKGVLTRNIALTNQISLKHSQSNISVSFSTNNYVNPLKKQDYQYRLAGFDNRYITTQEQTISYTNLRPGTYTLFIREANSDRDVVPHEISLSIKIASPWYATPLFYFLYVIIILSIIISFYRFKHSQLVLKTSLEFERKEKERNEELNHAKLQFFSNISHEFRTPLTLIISQMELLLQSNLAPFVYNKLLKIHRNTYHLRNLITELLDFRKLEQGHVTLKVREQDIIPFLKEIYYSFFEYADTVYIRYNFTSVSESLMCWFDSRQLQKVFFNLLSNAFKYTPAKGCIDIVVEETDNNVVVKVMDSGTGIAPEDIDKVFERFYQGNNSFVSKNFSGTGIGLSLCKSIVELHHGRIHVESRPEYGTIFLVHLPKGKDHFTGDEIVLQEENVSDLQDISSAFDTLDKQEESPENLLLPKQEGNRYKLLIVEDNEELLQLLCSLFSPIYDVIVARNGKEGLEMVRKEMPGIVVSDIMMPVMTGTEMCLKIKNDIEICHIPVILLTALNSPEQSIEGFKRGADDYISKPFNTKVLLARCNNILRNRLLLQKHVSQDEQINSRLLTTNPIDEKFITDIIASIEKNLDDPEMDMNILAKKMGLSRSSLYNKCKALTGMTPKDFMLNIKIRKAAALLISHPELQIQDISDQLGFATARNFSHCFKETFGTTPQQYRKKPPLIPPKGGN